MAPPVFKTGLAGNTLAGGFDSLPPPPCEVPSQSRALNESDLQAAQGGQNHDNAWCFMEVRSATSSGPNQWAASPDLVRGPPGI